MRIESLLSNGALSYGFFGYVVFSVLLALWRSKQEKDIRAQKILLDQANITLNRVYTKHNRFVVVCYAPFETERGIEVCKIQNEYFLN